MKKTIFALLAVCSVIFSTAGFGFAADTNAKKAKTEQLLGLLPASEAAMTIDVKRMTGEALPQILSANQPMLTEILAYFDQMKTRTGVDPRQFEQIAAGVSSLKEANGGYDYEPVALARGNFDSAALIAAAKIVAAGKYREEKIGDRTVYIFSPQTAMEQGVSKLETREANPLNSKIGGFLAKFLVGLNKDMALTAYDKNTLAVGSLGRVREMLEAKTRLSPEISSLVTRKPNSIVGFGAMLPNGLTNFFELEDDSLGAALGGVRQLYGSMDVASGNTVVAVVARTAEPTQAKTLKDTLAGFQTFAGILKGSKREDQKVYGRMLESVKLGQAGNELTVDLLVPQSDINVIVGAKK